MDSSTYGVVLDSMAVEKLNRSEMETFKMESQENARKNFEDLQNRLQHVNETMLNSFTAIAMNKVERSEMEEFELQLLESDRQVALNMSRELHNLRVILHQDKEKMYFTSSKNLTYLEAKEYCEMNRGHLIRLRNEYEAKYIASHITNQSHWTDAVKTGSHYTWSDNSEIMYTNWKSGHPRCDEETCAIFVSHEDQTWVPVNYGFGGRKVALCEKENMIASRLSEASPSGSSNFALITGLVISLVASAVLHLILVYAHLQVRREVKILSMRNTRVTYQRNADTCVLSQEDNNLGFMLTTVTCKIYVILQEGGYMGWEAANMGCKQLGGHLARPTSTAETAFLTTISQTLYYWIDAKKTGANYVWSDGSSILHTDWDTSNSSCSSDDCHIRIIPGGKWYVSEPHDANSAICELPLYRFNNGTPIHDTVDDTLHKLVSNSTTHEQVFRELSQQSSKIQENLQRQLSFSTGLEIRMDKMESSVNGTIVSACAAMVADKDRAKLYSVSPKSLIYLEAKEYCKINGGHLVRLKHAYEAEYIASHITNQSYWIDAIKNGSKYIWAGESEIDYTNWKSNQTGCTSETCAIFVEKEDQTWVAVDYRTGGRKMAVCEKDDRMLASRLQEVSPNGFANFSLIISLVTLAVLHLILVYAHLQVRREVKLLSMRNTRVAYQRRADTCVLAQEDNNDVDLDEIVG
ncbi:hypothetical protein HDE_00159 [Halotydeus destructor]|nr:hypothetical protein HDE_00159 [Halotydeus destructor]